MQVRALPAVIASTGISTGVILSDFAATATPWSDVPRPILVVLLFAIVIGSVATRVMSRLPAMVISVILTTIVVRPVLGLWIGAGLIAWVAVNRWGTRLFGWPDRADAAVPGTAAVGVLFALVNLVSAVNAQGLPSIPDRSAEASTGGENVYIILLDGYPRADTLDAELGYDNEPFMRGLEARGFTVDRRSQSLYDWTPLTIGHLLGVDVSAYPTDALTPPDLRDLRKSFADAPLLQEWRDAGYTVTTIRPATGHVAVPGSLDTGQVNEFEVVLLGRSLLEPYVGEWVMDQQRDRLNAQIATLEDIAQADGPQIVLAHLMAPHPPFLTQPIPTCWSSCGLWQTTNPTMDEPAEYAAALQEQLDYLNPRVLEAVDSVIEADSSAAVVIFSDHGNRHDPKGPEWSRNLYAIRGEPAIELEVPGH